MTATFRPLPLAVVIAALAAGSGTPSHAESKSGAKGKSPQTYQYLNALGDVLEAIRRDFVGPTDDRKLIEAAIRGVLQSLDSNSTFYSADDFKTQREAQQGKFGGIGIEVREKDGVVAVVTPIDGTPSARAGLQPGDLITHVDDTSIKGLGLAATVARMRGPLGTKVGLTVVREGQAEPLKVVLVRETITVRSIIARADGDVGYVRITRFDEPTLEQLRTGIRSLTQQIGRDRLKGFVLDLRNNPGGLLKISITVADEFLDKGEIVAERRRRPGDVKRHSARPGDVTGGKPLVVLVNRGTAGSAETLAGALSDHRRAIVVGTRSFGSGSIGTIVPLKQLGGAFRLTTAHLVRPSGRLIEGNGIDPDHVVEGNPTDPKQDKPLQFALQLLRGEATPRFRDPKQKPEGGLDLGGGDFK